MSEEIRILIADDDEIIRDALSNLLNCEEGMKVVTAVADGVQALKEMREHIIDVALIDVDMPVLDGIKTASIIRQTYPDVTVVMLTAFEQEGSFEQAVAQGVHGFLTKDIPAPQLAELIRQAHSGRVVMGPRPMEILTQAYAATAYNKVRYATFVADVEALPTHLRSTFDLLLEARTNKEIAEILHMSPKTIRSYVSDILTRTGFSSRGELAIAAVRAGLDR
ncbi:MAG: response regulator transcription factor [Actinomycetaceae bacterium]|nr:response regulator transcription factor [Actinomycetaceae bacterium]MDY5853908.1 response regulator transcription factor [Arcanobacterium sp.]